ncbi:g818 [Coccomyxa viridis]|uniref:G818 protein n=1 Tax=Coccomyxa viridis TaxID=1274662 RepID=A0ABP1FLV7_9CHLO
MTAAPFSTYSTCQSSGCGAPYTAVNGRLVLQPPPLGQWSRRRRAVYAQAQGRKSQGRKKAVDQGPASITAPLKVQVQEQLTPVEKLSMAPFWSTFCGTSNGAWQGVQAAFSPVTGNPEPVTIGKDGEPALDVRTITFETRVVEDDEDKVLRRTMHATSASALQAQAASATAKDQSKGEANPDVAWDVEHIASDEHGLVIFDGGAYSRGPAAIFDDDENSDSGQDEALEADKERLERQLSLEPSTSEGASSEADEEESLASQPDVGGDAVLKSQRTWLVEQCLAWGGEQRLRLRLTLAFLPGEEELEVEVLRIAMLRENWQCLAEDESPSCVADPSEILPELSAAPRPGPAQMAGPWKVFDVTAVPVPDEAAIGDDPKTLLMYFSNETQQDWRPGKREPDEAGGAFWLPGNVLLELHMIPPTSRGSDGDAEEGMELQAQGRGLCISFSWLINDKTLIGLQREYDADGNLLEVRSRTAILGNWAGGRM